MSANDITCPKCGRNSGDDWKQCGGRCPMPGSPHYDATLKAGPLDPRVARMPTPTPAPRLSGDQDDNLPF
jgi:hypothetical protein